jgi:hypothetical protein
MLIARVAFMLIALNLAVTAALDASAASINFSGTVEGSSISIDATPALPCPPCYYPYLELNNGNFTATAVDGFNSLTGVSPSNIALTVGRLAAVAFSTDPTGCTYPNCQTLTQSYEAFSSASQINLLLDGSTVATAAPGVFSVVLVTNPVSPSFLTETGSGTAQVMSGSGAFYEELLTQSGGTGKVLFNFTNFTPISSGLFDVAGTMTVVPEPTTASLFILGLASVMVGRQRLT